MVQLKNKSPVTDEVLKAYRNATDTDIAAAFGAARTAFALWRDVPMRKRAEHLRKLRHVIAGDLERIVDVVCEVTGKVRVEALAADIYPTLDLIKYCEKNAERVLKRRGVKTPVLFQDAFSYVEHAPYGVVLVISPWNYPLQLAMVPAVTALAAGNAVILKPSEVTLTVGELIGELFRKAGFPEGLVQVLYGDGETGRRLIEAGPGKVFFTGSAATGARVMAAAARNVIPVEMELGSKDPMIVFDDAPFGRAVRGAVNGAFSNSGQICVSIERLYVQSSVHDRFVEALVEEAGRVRVGSGFDADIGAITYRKQVAIIEEQLKDAVAKGARILTQPRRQGYFYHPVVLVGATHEMKIMREETFGPVLPVMAFDSEDDAVRLANDSEYGLNASVWTRDLSRGRRVASRLDTGNCVVNDVIRNIANPYLPYGGVKKSGFGRYHGPEGLYAFSQEKAVMVNLGKAARELNWFPYSRRMYEGLGKFLRLFYGDLGAWDRVRGFMETAEFFRHSGERPPREEEEGR